MQAIRAVEARAGRPIGVLMDLQGPKLRIGTFSRGPVMLAEGDITGTAEAARSAGTGVFQPGLFDRRAERTAAAQAARVEEAVERSHARLSTLDRLRHLRADEQSVVFGVAFRP